MKLIFYLLIIETETAERKNSYLANLRETKALTKGR